MVLKTGRVRMRSREDERVRKRRDDGSISGGNDVNGNRGGGEKASLRSGFEYEMTTSLAGEKMVGGETDPKPKRIVLYTVVTAMGGCEPIG